MNKKLLLLGVILVFMPVNASERITIDSEVAARGYHLIPIAIALTILYLATYALAKKKIIQYRNCIKLWNVFLLITFLISTILGIILVIRINFNWNPNLHFNMLYWHVETGIVLAVISIFHISWHWRYFYHLIQK